MTTYLRVGHILSKLAMMPEQSVHMAWTSVPYWGLRSYGTDPQVWGGSPSCDHEFPEDVERTVRGCRGDKVSIDSNHNGRLERQNLGSFCIHCGAWRGEHGLEPTFDLWLVHEVLIFREIRRVLRNDGTAWVNVGDAYATAPAGNKDNGQDPRNGKRDDRTFRVKPFNTSGTPGFKNKDRIMMPARLAIALQDDGWWLRDEIVWHKRNPMPSSVKDRTTPAHEMIYLFSKRARYFFDCVAIVEPCAVEGWDDGTRIFGGPNKAGANAKHARTTGRVANGKRYSFARDGVKMNDVPGQKPQFRADRQDTGERPATRNKRSVWSLASEPYRGAHFATAPTGIVRPCILAGTSAKGVCPHCGAPWVRISEREFSPQGDVSPERGIRGAGGQKPMDASSEWDGFPRGATVHHTKGWCPTCGCENNAPIPATVLDPFGGSGTTALVADELGRDAVLIELNPDYAEIAVARIRGRLGKVVCDDGLENRRDPVSSVPGTLL